MQNLFDSIKKYLPNKVIAGDAISLAPTESWMYDDGMGDPWWQGAAAAPFRWILEANVIPSTHSSHLTRTPYSYNALDITPGMWVVSTNDARAVKIISILSKTTETISCLVEDVDRYNTFKDLTSQGGGVFGAPASLIFFQLGDDGLPVLDPLPATATDIGIISQIEARFRVFNPIREVQFYQVNHGFKLGTVVRLDNVTKKFVEASANDVYIAGTVTAIGPGPNQFYLSPSTKFIVDIEPSLPGTVGSIIWIDPVSGALTAVPNGSNAPVFIQMNDAVPSYTIGAVDNPSSWDGTQFFLNRSLITLSGGDPISTTQIIDAINAKTNEHGCLASLGSSENSITGTVEFPSTAVSSSLSFKINNFLIEVSPPSITYGDSGQVGWLDIVRSVNEQTAFHDVFASYDPDMGYLKFRNPKGEDINFENVFPVSSSIEDGLLTFTDMAGVAANNQALPPSRLKIVRSSGGEIVISNVAGDFESDAGIQSAANGKIPLALVVDKSIAATGNYMVADLAARDALDNVRTGDQVFVQSSSDGEWALFVFNGISWIKLADADSANTDANTLTASFDYQSTSPIIVGTVSDNSRIANVTVVVTEEFDGGATLSVGIPGQPDVIMSSDIIDLSLVGSYEASSTYTYFGVAEGEIQLVLSASSATKGQAQVVISYL